MVRGLSWAFSWFLLRWVSYRSDLNGNGGLSDSFCPTESCAATPVGFSKKPSSIVVACGRKASFCSRLLPADPTQTTGVRPQLCWAVGDLIVTPETSSKYTVIAHLFCPYGDSLIPFHHCRYCISMGYSSAHRYISQNSFYTTCVCRWRRTVTWASFTSGAWSVQTRGRLRYWPDTRASGVRVRPAWLLWRSAVVAPPRPQPTSPSSLTTGLATVRRIHLQHAYVPAPYPPVKSRWGTETYRHEHLAIFTLCIFRRRSNFSIYF